MDNEVSVFYPCDQDEYILKIQNGNALWYPHGMKSVEGSANVIKSVKPGKEMYTPKRKNRWLHQIQLKMQVAMGAHPSNEFKEKKLIPVVFSHGYGASRTLHSSICRDLASQGYIVFTLDHKDGTCCYTEDKSGKGYLFTNKQDVYDFELRKKQIETRVKEVEALIDEIENWKRMRDSLFGKSEVELDFEKLVMAGHSMGGCTSALATSKDPRIKICLTLDPWFFGPHQKVLSGQVTLKVPLQIIETEKFVNEPMHAEHNYSTAQCNQALIKSSPTIDSEDLILKGVHHLH